MRTTMIGRTATFASAARCYWFEVFPIVRRELRNWRVRAEAIPEPGPRRDALLALRTKSGNAEGLAAYAVLAPRAQRRQVIRAAVASNDHSTTSTRSPSAQPSRAPRS